MAGEATGAASGPVGSGPAVATVFPRCAMAVMVVERTPGYEVRHPQSPHWSSGYHPGDASTWSTSGGRVPCPRRSPRRAEVVR